ncbi:MAG: signal recognition particle-docking protein FtsY [Candidatus Hydrogenedentes bacterium]|nr:signal recognition particle-docking protein FtsY [Candidatus Hydrogenedentota bacterium]
MAKTGFIGRLREKLEKSRDNLVGNVKRALGRPFIDDEAFDALEEVLIGADVGVATTLKIIEEMRGAVKARRLTDSEDLIALLKEELTGLLSEGNHAIDWSRPGSPHVTLVAGVNGSGKTTTTGKLASRLIADGRTVLLGAADTFRAAATEQLAIWSERTGADLVRLSDGADPASVAYDATDAAVARKIDNVLIDTAGRLHTKVNLMEELKKIQRVVRKRIPDAPHEVLLVLDATTGQNGLEQARQFTQALDVTGIILTKLDGTAKGGMAVAIQRELGIPIKMIGIGESVDDLDMFDAREFVEALFAQ